MSKRNAIHFLCTAQLFCALLSSSTAAQPLPRVSLREAVPLLMPGAHEFNAEWGVDGNSPAERDAMGQLIIFNSLSYPWRSIGPDLFQMRPSERIDIFDRDQIEGGLWLEATYRDQSGFLLGWFHNEINAGCTNDFLAIPRIRQMISYDDGQSWIDLGVVLEASTDSAQCDTANLFFAAGHGDFSVLFDAATQHFYFYFTSYHREYSEQGVAVARLASADHLSPAGKAWKWNGTGWDEPGVGGRVAPIMQPFVNWHETDANAFWGPALHYNTYLQQYVMLLNRAGNESWGTEGIYISYNDDLANPLGWSVPQRLPLEMESPHLAYPQVIGLEADGTDKSAGKVARLFFWGQSFWEIVFERPRALLPQVKEYKERRAKG
jgi:hypothetical protein